MRLFILSLAVLLASKTLGQTANFDANNDGCIGTADLTSFLATFGNCLNAENFNLEDCGNTVTYHGFEYSTIMIGEQCWFAENLRSSLYSNGDSIPTEWNNGLEGACGTYQDNEDLYLEPFGRLYNWGSTVDSRGLCPSGWRVSSDADWIELESLIGMDSAQIWNVGPRGIDEAYYLKALPSANPSWNGSDDYGLGIVPAGGREFWGWFGGYGYAGSNAFFWTSDQNGTNGVCRWFGNGGTIQRTFLHPKAGFSVRCILND